MLEQQGKLKRSKADNDWFPPWSIWEDSWSKDFAFNNYIFLLTPKERGHWKYTIESSTFYIKNMAHILPNFIIWFEK